VYVFVLGCRIPTKRKRNEGSTDALLQKRKLFLSYFDTNMCPLPESSLVKKERIERYKSAEHS